MSQSVERTVQRWSTIVDVEYMLARHYTEIGLRLPAKHLDSHKMFRASLEMISVAPKLNHVLENEDRSSGPVNIATEQ